MKKNDHKPYFLVEIIWLVMAFLCAGLGIHTFFADNNKFNYVFFIFSALSLLMYLMRRYMRKNNMYKRKD